MTVRDQEAVQVSGLGCAQCLRRLPQELRQSLHARYPDDVNVIVTAEGLDQGEVNLQSDVILLFFVYGQEAQDHAVGVPEGEKGCHGDARPGADVTVHWGGHELPEPQAGGVDKTHGAPGVCATTDPQPQYCTGAGVTDYANTDGGGGGGTQSKVTTIILSKQKPQSFKLATSGFCSESLSPSPKNSLRNVALHSPTPRALGKSPTAPSPAELLESACIRGAPPPTPGKGGADSHIHQFGRLVHPHGEAILTLRGH